MKRTVSPCCSCCLPLGALPISVSPLHTLLSGPGLLPVISGNGISLGDATLTVRCFMHITLPLLDCKSPEGSTLAVPCPTSGVLFSQQTASPQTHLTDTNDSTDQSPDTHCMVAVPAACFSGHQGPLPLLLTPQLFLCSFSPSNFITSRGHTLVHRAQLSPRSLRYAFSH